VPDQQPFTVKDLEWFAKNAYNLSLQYCSDISPEALVRILNVCIEVDCIEGRIIPGIDIAQFIEFLKDEETSEAAGGLSLRRVFCEFLAACTYITLARAEDQTEIYVSLSCLSSQLLTDTFSSNII
jgi:hypothetical protein